MKMFSTKRWTNLIFELECLFILPTDKHTQKKCIKCSEHHTVVNKTCSLAYLCLGLKVKYIEITVHRLYAQLHSLLMKLLHEKPYYSWICWWWRGKAKGFWAFTGERYNDPFPSLSISVISLPLTLQWCVSWYYYNGKDT